MNSIFDKNGFNTKNFDYRSFKEGKQIDTNNFDFILFNNSIKNKGKEEISIQKVKTILELLDFFEGKAEKYLT